MNDVEAKDLLEQTLATYRKRPYAELLLLVDRCETFERVSSSGAIYQIEIDVFFDDNSRGDLRVQGTIDDGGWRAFAPVCADFVITSDGTFVGE